MKPETLVHGLVGTVGTTVAAISSQHVAVFAGISTGLWMLWQLGCSVYDRFLAPDPDDDLDY